MSTMSQCEADKLDSLEDGTAKWLMADWLECARSDSLFILCIHLFIQ